MRLSAWIAAGMAPSQGRSLSLFLSVCMSVCLSVCLPGPAVPGKMLETIKTLQQQQQGLYNSLQGQQDQFNGSPVFSRDTLNKMEDGDKRVVLAKMLEVYDKLFDQMLSQLPTSSQSEKKEPQEAGIQYLQDMVRRLKRIRYKKHLPVISTLEQLGHIQINNSVVQSKALWELPWLFHEASSLAGRERRSLRRRSLMLAKLRRAM